MHKRFVNHCTIELTLQPNGPILIKSGREGVDPTKPAMEFVDTYHGGRRSIYLPGSSLKGAIRAHAERIVRTVGSDRPPQSPDPDDASKIRPLWATDPLQQESYDYLEKFFKESAVVKENETDFQRLCRLSSDGQKMYRWSSFTDQLFGSTEIASRCRIEDAYPTQESLRLEERNGVAIDRVFGSVAVGPFNYQVCTAGEFQTKIHLKNFTLAQLGLIGLALWDLDDGWFGIGFAKSRGLGTVKVILEKAVVQYPGCILDEKNNQKFATLNQTQSWPQPILLGVGEFLEGDRHHYGFRHEEQATKPSEINAMELGLGVQLCFNDESTIKQELFAPAVETWKAVVPARSA